MQAVLQIRSGEIVYKGAPLYILTISTKAKCLHTLRWVVIATTYLDDPIPKCTRFILFGYTLDQELLHLGLNPLALFWRNSVGFC